jgi:hypothetical protein
MERMSEIEAAKVRATEGTKAEIQTEQNQRIIESSGGNYVFNQQGEAVPVSPYQAAEDSLERRSREKQIEATQASIDNYRSLIEDRANNPDNIKLKDITAESYKVHKAIGEYNAIISSPDFKRGRVDDKQSLNLARARSILEQYGITAPEGGKPITGYTRESVNQVVTNSMINTMNELNELRARLTSGEQQAQPGSPTDSVQKYMSNPAVANAPNIDAAANAIMATLSTDSPEVIQNLKATGSYDKYVEELKQILLTLQGE